MLVRFNSGGGDWLSFDASAGDAVRSRLKAQQDRSECAAMVGRSRVFGFCFAGSTCKVGLQFEKRLVDGGHVLFGCKTLQQKSLAPLRHFY